MEYIIEMVHDRNKLPMNHMFGVNSTRSSTMRVNIVYFQITSPVIVHLLQRFEYQA